MNTLNEEQISEIALQVSAHGYCVVKDIYDKQAINETEKKFSSLFHKRYQQGRVQSRDFRRFTCKLPISDEYIDVLKNESIHRVLTEILGEDYVLYNFNSHSSLPGSSRQVMHFDSVDPKNSDTYISSETKVVFLHIPLLDTRVEHGPTDVWPAIIHKQENTLIQEYDWISRNLPANDTTLNQGDVIIRRDNCVHAGGKNSSQDERHFITLVFTKKDYYLNYNSGMIPGASYPDLNLPYRIATQCNKPPQNTEQVFNKLDWAQLNSNDSVSPFSIKFQQYARTSNSLNNEFLDQLESSDLENSNVQFNLINAVLPLAKNAFGRGAFYIHSITRRRLENTWTNDEPGFGKSAKVISSHAKVCSVKLFLNKSPCSVQLCPGDINACFIATNNEQFREKQSKSETFQRGDILINTGAIPYRPTEGEAEVLEILFVSEDFDMLPENRVWISDNFALSLPKPLAKLLKYNNIFITQERYRDFELRKLNYIYYLVFNYIELHQKSHPIQGNLMKLGVGIFFIPVMIYFSLEKPISKMLGTS